MIVFEGDKALFNQYGIVPVARAACPNAKEELARLFADWLVSTQGQQAIGAYKKAGSQLFMPNAR